MPASMPLDSLPDLDLGANGVKPDTEKPQKIKEKSRLKAEDLAGFEGRHFQDERGQCCRKENKGVLIVSQPPM